MSVLDVLLAGSGRNVAKKPLEAEAEVLRLSEQMGAPVVFSLRGLSLQEIQDVSEAGTMLDLHTVMTGVTNPPWADVRLAVTLGLLQPGEQWGDHGVSQVDAVSALLLPGEIGELALRIQQLTGYKKVTTKEVKKN